MPNLNKVMLMGNLTRDPELRYLPSNMAVVGLGLAVNRRWRNQQGEQQEETTFVDCEAFGKTAELLNQYLKKGRPVYLEGRLKLDQWQDREGGNRSKLKVIVENFQFIDSREGGAGGGSGGGGYQGGNAGGGSGGGGSNYGNRGNSADGGGNYNNAPQQDPHQPVDEDDIPF
jgi:single-strand DNA-binding protein